MTPFVKKTFIITDLGENRAEMRIVENGTLTNVITAPTWFVLNEYLSRTDATWRVERRNINSGLDATIRKFEA